MVRDEGCQYHLLKQAVVQPEITGSKISSKHLRPCCSSPNTAVCGVSEGVKKGVKLHVPQGNLDIFIEETQQTVVIPAVVMSPYRKRYLQGAELLWRCGVLCVHYSEQDVPRGPIPNEMGLTP